MRYRQFGKTGWRVSEIGFGGARIGGLLAQDGGRATSLKTLEAACDAGINFFDTADMYSQGESEILVGKAFRHKRDKVFIATKGGYSLPRQKRLIQLIKPFAKPIVRALGLRRSAVPASLSGTVSQDFSPDYLRKAVEASLRRLQSDHVDLYQIHSPPRDELRGNKLQRPRFAAVESACRVVSGLPVLKLLSWSCLASSNPMVVLSRLMKPNCAGH